MKSILDPSFSYTSSLHTDVRKTFARIRREQKKREALNAPPLSERSSNILAMPRLAPSLPDSGHARSMQESERVRRPA